MNDPEETAHDPATIRRGGDPEVPTEPDIELDTPERKLEQGLEETMAGSDPVSIVQPVADVELPAS
jgi:hypothetical protein